MSSKFYLVTLLGLLAACGRDAQSSLTRAASEPQVVDVGLGNRIWACDSDTDPDTLSVDIYEKDGAYTALLGEQTGDGDNYDVDAIGFDLVEKDGHAVFTQNSAPHWPLPFVGSKTKGMHLTLDLKPHRTDRGAEYFDAEASAKAAPSGYSAEYPLTCDPKPGIYKAQLVDMRQAFADQTVKPKVARSLVVVSDLGGRPTIEAVEGSETCEGGGAGDFVKRGNDWAVVIETQYVYDEGPSQCFYRLKQVDGSSATLVVEQSLDD